MKMKAVCDRTGLTERTVRYYVEQGLLSPASFEKGERVYTDFSEEDVRRLERVAVLRKAGFSIADIHAMTGDPAAIPSTVSARREQLAGALRDGDAVLRVLDTLRTHACRDVDELAGRLEAVAAAMALPPADIAPNFARFEKATDEEKARALADYEKNQDRRLRRGGILVTGIMLVEAALTVLGFILNPGGSGFLGLLLTAVLLVLLYKGYAGVRIFFAVMAGLAVLGDFLTLMQLLESGGEAFRDFPGRAVLLLAVLLLSTAYHLAAAVLLFVSKSISEFLYSRRNG